jgi:hypothetical protein
METLMANGESGPIVDPEIDKALSELLAQTEKEPISPRLRELSKRLEAALEDARQRRGSNGDGAR